MSFIWKESTNGEMCFKDAYIFQKSLSNKVPWTKIIWNPSVHPSRSIWVWRLFHNKIPTNENLRVK